MTYTPPNKMLTPSRYKQKATTIKYCEKCKRDVIIASEEEWMRHRANCNGVESDARH